MRNGIKNRRQILGKEIGFLRTVLTLFNTTHSKENTKGGLLMAHTCPVCGATCHCNGDIDDLCLDFEDDVMTCDHCEEYDEEDEPEYLGCDAD